MIYQRLALTLLVLLLTSCSGQGSYSGPPPGTYILSVNVTGLPIDDSASLQVQNNGTSTLSFTSNTTQSFPYQSVGSSYNVTISAQPFPINCSVSSGSGVNASANTVTVNVVCSSQYVYVTNFSNNNLSVLQLGQAGLLRSISQLTTGGEPSSVVVHPNGQFVYVANQQDNTVWVYKALNGILTYIAKVATGSQPFSLSMSPSGAYLYCANINDGTISEYAVSQGGTLTPVASSPLTVETSNFGLNSITVDPSGKYVYVTGLNSGNFYGFQIQPDGSLVSLQTKTAELSLPKSVVISPSGNFAYVVNSGAGNVAIYPISSGLLGSPSLVSVGAVPHAIAFTPSGTLAYVSNYGVNGDGNTISQFTVNASSGLLVQMTNPTFTASQPNAAGPFALAVDASGYSLFVANYPSNSLSEYVITSTGALTTPVQTYTGLLTPASIAVH